MHPDHLQQLAHAKYLLETPAVAARLSNALGTPIEKAVSMLPKRASDVITSATRKALDAALKAALKGFNDQRKAPANRLHQLTVAASGGLGGAFGLPALALELPVSTTLMLRSIADIARSEGEQLTEREAQLACLAVFALGGPGESDDGAETGYFGIRAAMAKAMSDALAHVAHHGMAQQGAPAMVRFMAQVAARFSIPVSQKVAAQSVPIIGALGGATVNALFMEHFQKMATGHFTVRRLERLYGAREVQRRYALIAI
ncbi:EcsC family protein [uncultured Gilvimarinus sp.]|uniref:EcsC family protein n=1 Tax=uncultured Gilvimarinus sp. TaxID=1689143 RepID=UPI0030EF4018|tara:strand:+ start:4707 stop:5483 length:777 start_codon:yes stop_codon:yes gene_type:complete